MHSSGVGDDCTLDNRLEPPSEPTAKTRNARLVFKPGDFTHLHWSHCSFASTRNTSSCLPRSLIRLTFGYFLVKPICSRVGTAEFRIDQNTRSSGATWYHASLNFRLMVSIFSALLHAINTMKHTIDDAEYIVDWIVLISINQRVKYSVHSPLHYRLDIKHPIFE